MVKQVSGAPWPWLTQSRRSLMTTNFKEIHAATRVARPSSGSSGRPGVFGHPSGAKACGLVRTGSLPLYEYQNSDEGHGRLRDEAGGTDRGAGSDRTRFTGEAEALNEVQRGRLPRRHLVARRRDPGRVSD